MLFRFSFVTKAIAKRSICSVICFLPIIYCSLEFSLLLVFTSSDRLAAAWPLFNQDQYFLGRRPKGIQQSNTKSLKENKEIERSLFSFSDYLMETPSGLEKFNSFSIARFLVASINKNGDQIYERGRQKYRESQFLEAIRLWQEALVAYQQSGNRLREGYTLANIGFAYSNLNNYNSAVDYQQRCLSAAREINERKLEALCLYGLGVAYEGQGRYDNGVDSYIQSIGIARGAGDQRTEAQALNALGAAYRAQALYAEAINVYEQSFELAEAIGELREQGRILNGLGNLYSSSGSYSEAINAYQRSIEIARRIPDRAGEASALIGLGSVYSRVNDFDRASQYWQQSLVIAREISDESLEITLLSLLRSATPEEVIENARINGDRSRETFGWINLGLSSFNSRNYNQAMLAFQQALTIAQSIGERETEARILYLIGSTVEQQNQKELAIVFYKQSVNVVESIRSEILPLSQNFQESYLESVSVTYRRLADLLLSQGRILEAQQVLELLKVEELEEFTRGEVLNIATREIRLSEAEQEVWDKFGGLIEFGKRLEEIGCTASGNLTQCASLFQQRRVLTSEFNMSVESFITEFRGRLSEDFGTLNPENFIGEADDILQTPGTALIYPVVLDDKLWVLWATSGGVVNSVEVPVTQQQLGEAVLCFRQLLESPTATSCETRDTTDIQTIAQELYRYLIPPQLEQEFDQQTASGTPVQNLVFSLDRVTRYIPMAALHNGDRYLLEDFNISTILSAGLTRTDNPLPSSASDTSVLALGLSEAVPENPREEVPGFNALQHVPAEINAISEIYPGQPWMNGEWDDATFYDLPNHQILHIATHGEFVPARHDRSYLILGNKSPLRIQAIEDIQQSFSDLSLVVLSACETALGAPDQEGIEINGIAHSFIKAGANTVLASLWQVSDSSTSQLMQRFYGNLAQSTPESPVTISQALREAQLSLLQSRQENEDDAERGATGIRQREEATDREAPAEIDYSHPYYWAPFILIGNGM